MEISLLIKRKLKFDLLFRMVFFLLAFSCTFEVSAIDWRFKSGNGSIGVQGRIRLPFYSDINDAVIGIIQIKDIFTDRKTKGFIKIGILPITVFEELTITCQKDHLDEFSEQLYEFFFSDSPKTLSGDYLIKNIVIEFMDGDSLYLKLCAGESLQRDGMNLKLKNGTMVRNKITTPFKNGKISIGKDKKVRLILSGKTIKI